MNDTEQTHELRIEASRALEEALYEIKRVIVGQDAMLERLLVSLLVGGHVLLEGVPGLAKTLTVKTLSAVLGGSYGRIQFTPDLVPADLVGTRVYRPDSGGFDTELGPVHCNFLLADEINRAPAKVQSALLEVMQEQQVTIGGTTFPVPLPFIGDGDPEPDRVRGHVPAARGSARPLPDEGPRRLSEHRRGSGRGRTKPRRAGRRTRAPVARGSAPLRRRGGERCWSTARRSGTRSRSRTRPATRPSTGLGEIAHLIDFGASPRGPIALVRPLASSRCSAVAATWRRPTSAISRPTCCATGSVLSYDALSEGVTADKLLEQVLATVPVPDAEHLIHEAPTAVRAV